MVFGWLCAIAAPAVAVEVPYLEVHAAASATPYDSGTVSGSSGHVVKNIGGTLSGYGRINTAHAKGSASFGVLRASSSAFAVNDVANAGAGPRFRDSLMITAPGIATGTPGIFEFAIQVEGSMSVQNGEARWSYSMAGNGWSIVAESRVWQWDDHRGSGVEGDPFGGIYTSGSRVFRFGEPYWFEVLLGASTYAGGQDITGSSAADFGNSLTWGGILGVQDFYSRAAVTGYSVTSASGTDYSRPIPEPAAGLLAALGGVVLAFRLRKRRRAA